MLHAAAALTIPVIILLNAYREERQEVISKQSVP